MKQPSCHSSLHDVVIVSAVRTPLCRAGKGKLANIPASTLLTVVLRGVLQSQQAAVAAAVLGSDNTNSFVVSPEDVQDICIGNCLGSPAEFAATRMAQIAAGIPCTVPISVVNRQCSSGLQAIQNIASAIQSGSIQIGIAGGVESMSATPMKKSTEAPFHVDWDTMKEYPDAMDCLVPMGVTSENVANKYSLTRSDLDAFAYQSHQKAHMAQMSGKFMDEIIPVGDVTQDDGIRPSTTLDGLSKLRPVFDKKAGSTTAGNSSQLTDGASAVLLMTRAEATKRKLRILGVWKGYSVVGVPPKFMGIGPRYAIPALLSSLRKNNKNCHLHVSDIDVFEINEAFASQASWCIKELNIDPQKVNPNGGAIALGHPLGCTGTRLVVTLLHEMNRSKSRHGIVSMCIGTGMGAAALFEVEQQRGVVMRSSL